MAKGGNFEREVAKLLSLWWTEGERDDCIWRTDASGARATQRGKRGKKTAFQHGDLTFTDTCAAPLFQVFSIECKTGYARKTKSGETQHWCVLDLIDSAQAETIFDKMWAQAVDDAEKSERRPLLIFRRNRRVPCIAMTTELYQGLQFVFGSLGFSRVTISTVIHGVIIMSLKDFMEWIPNIRLFITSFLEDTKNDNRPVHRELPSTQNKLDFIRARRECNKGLI